MIKIKLLLGIFIVVSIASCSGGGSGGNVDNGNTPGDTTGNVAVGPLKVHLDNPRYFTDGSERIIFLTGSHTWCNFQDCGDTYPPSLFNFSGYLDFLKTYNHNFFRLWRAEHARGGEGGDDFWFDPMPYMRPGPGTALDGKPRFDLHRFNEIYFARMRSRVIEAGKRGIYVSIMLFNGWSVEDKNQERNPWPGHPLHRANNINGIDGDPNGNSQGEETHTLANPSVVALQETYVRKVIDTVGDLENVLYEISNESHSGSVEWQYHMIDIIKQYEAGKLKQHPVGMTIPWPGGDNTDLFSSPADWISPNGDVDSPAIADGKKVILFDTDHLCGICGDPAWVWKSLTRGCNPVFMDPYDRTFIASGVPADYDPGNANDMGIRKSMGWALSFSNRINLAAMAPCEAGMASSDYCLAHAAEADAQYLVYLPTGGQVTVDLTRTAGRLQVEWFNATTGQAQIAAEVDGGAAETFVSPFGSTHSILYLFQ